jgi:hypothetical protein
MAVHICITSTKEAEAGHHEFKGQSGIHSKEERKIRAEEEEERDRRIDREESKQNRKNFVFDDNADAESLDQPILKPSLFQFSN